MVYSFQHPLSLGWDRQLEEGKPDCRLAGGERRRTAVNMRGLSWEKVFCANCGADGGFVTEGVPYVFYVCDTPECTAYATITRKGISV